MLKSRSVSTKEGLNSARNDHDGKEIGNLVLLASVRQEWVRLSPLLELVRLKLHQVLHEAGEAIKYHCVGKPYRSIWQLQGG